MRQRLALERALLHSPRLLLLDEPFTGLDEHSASMLIERLSGLRAEGRLVLLATHDLDLAEGLVDRAAILRDGVLLGIEPMAGSLRDRYRRAIAGGRAGSHTPATRETVPR
jgi:ABC-2 type transport system ATP-binding protein